MKKATTNAQGTSKRQTSDRSSYNSNKQTGTNDGTEVQPKSDEKPKPTATQTTPLYTLEQLTAGGNNNDSNNENNTIIEVKSDDESLQGEKKLYYDYTKDDLDFDWSSVTVKQENLLEAVTNTTSNDTKPMEMRP